MMLKYFANVLLTIENKDSNNFSVNLNRNIFHTPVQHFSVIVGIGKSMNRLYAVSVLFKKSIRNSINKSFLHVIFLGYILEINALICTLQ